MELYIVRHGQTDINIENRINGLNESELNQKGIEQAEDARNEMENIDYDLMICSPLIRTKQTAELINAKNKEIIFDRRIVERDAGEFTEKSIDLIDPDDWWNLNHKEDYHDAEKIEDMIKRVYEFLDEIKETHKDRNIILVTHGGTSKIIQSYFCGMPEDGNFEKYKHENCEVKKFIL